MKAAVMLRGIDKKGGTGVYARNLVPELVRIGSEHDWFLLYSSQSQTDVLDLPPGVQEEVLRAPHEIIWDQVTVPGFVRGLDIDVLFNTKFTVPLATDVPCVMALHGASWYTIPQCYPWWDVCYIRAAMPLYCRKAAHLVSNSRCTTRDYVRYVNVPEEKVTTVPLAAAPNFEPVRDPDRLAAVRQRYDLPDRFILSVVAYDPRKNVPRLLEAFVQAHGRVDASLVLVGRGCDRYLREYSELLEPVREDVVTPGWIEQEDLPAIYSMASVFFFPSVYEEFGIPNCEAMACGTPIVTSSTGAPPDIVGDAGLLVDPGEPREMADALVRVLKDSALRERLSEQGRRRSRQYSWSGTAAGTLNVLEKVSKRSDGLTDDREAA